MEIHNSFCSSIAITPSVSELKLFIASEDAFYGLCNLAEIYCKYHVETGRLYYVTEEHYQSKLFDVDMVFTTNLDNKELTTTPQAYSDPVFGCEYLIHIINCESSLTFLH